MRSMTITALILIFCAISSVVATIAPQLNVNTQPNMTMNQTTLQTFNEQGELVNGQDAQNTYYSRGTGIVDTLFSMVEGTIFIGKTLQTYGVDAGLAYAINAILGILVAFDLFTAWKGINW